MMYSDDYLMEMQDLLKCGRCSKVLKDPLTLLPCQHNFCRICVQKIRENQATDDHEEPGVRCPLCQRFSLDDDVRECPLVIKIVELHNTLAKQKAEQDAAERERLRNKPDTAEWKCMDCSMYMCDDCKKKHLMVPMFSGHVMAGFDRKDDPVTKTDQDQCSTHSDMPVNCYCLECTHEPFEKYKSALHTSLKEKLAKIEKDQAIILKRLRRANKTAEDLAEIRQRENDLTALKKEVQEILDKGSTQKGRERLLKVDPSRIRVYTPISDSSEED